MWRLPASSYKQVFISPTGTVRFVYTPFIVMCWFADSILQPHVIWIQSHQSRGTVMLQIWLSLTIKNGSDSKKMDSGCYCHHSSPSSPRHEVYVMRWSCLAVRLLLPECWKDHMVRCWWTLGGSFCNMLQVSTQKSSSQLKQHPRQSWK